MPPYPWLHRDTIDPEDVRASVATLQKLGHPYPDDTVERVPDLLQEQGEEIVGRLADKGIETSWDAEIVAVIAYLQSLGVDGQAMLDATAEGGAQ